MPINRGSCVLEGAMKFQVFSIIILAVALSLPNIAVAAKKKAQGVFTVVKGKVKIQRAGKKKARKVKVGTKVYAKDTITAAKDSRAKVVMVDKNILNISPKSKIEISEYEYDEKSKKKKVMLNLMYGKVRSTVKQKYDGDKNVYRVKTPSAVAGVRGTDFFVNFNSRSRQSQIVTFEGQVQVGSGINAAGAIMNAVPVNPGQFTVSTPSQPPRPAVQVPKGQLVNLDRGSNADLAATAPDTQDAQPREPANKGPNSDDQKPDDGANQNPDSNNNEPKQDNQRGPDSANEPGPRESFEGDNAERGPEGGPEGEKGPNQRGPRGPKGPNAPDARGPNNAGPGFGATEGPGGEGFDSNQEPEFNADGSKAPGDQANQDPGFDPTRNPASIDPNSAPPAPEGEIGFLPPPSPDIGYDETFTGPDPIGEFDQYQPIDPNYQDPSLVDGYLPPGVEDAIQNSTRLIITIGN